MDRDEAMRLMGDYLEGDLPGEVRIAFEAHVLYDPVCSRELDRLKSVIASAGQLPKGIAPRRDLWPEIEGRLGAGSRRGFRRRLERFRRPLPAVAALLLLAAGSILGARLLGGDGSRSTPFARLIERGVVELRGMASAEEEYLRIVDDLSRSVDRVRAGLPRSTRRLLDAHLKLVDDAISASHSAVVQHPSDPYLQEMLAEAWLQKVELLEMTARIVTLES